MYISPLTGFTCATLTFLISFLYLQSRFFSVLAPCSYAAHFSLSLEQNHTSMESLSSQKVKGREEKHPLFKLMALLIDAKMQHQLSLVVPVFAVTGQKVPPLQKDA